MGHHEGKDDPRHSPALASRLTFVRLIGQAASLLDEGPGDERGADELEQAVLEVEHGGEEDDRGQDRVDVDQDGLLEPLERQRERG